MATGVADENTPTAGADEDDNGGARLFSGVKLWFSRAVPQRDWLIQNAQLNGAEIVPLENQADILLVDHMRKNQAPGTTSYRFVEQSIRKGQLEDLEQHAVGTATRAQRPVGSVTTASKGGRNAFTEAEDQFLWNMIRPYKDRGGFWKGNEIYKQIERINPRHPFQSWRDRWIKHTQFQKRHITLDIDLDAMQVENERLASLPRYTVRRQSPEVGQVELAEPRASLRLSPKKRSRDDMEEARKLRPSLAEATQQTQRPRTPDQRGVGSTNATPIVTPLSQRTTLSPRKDPPRARSPVQFTKPFPFGFTDYEAKELYNGTAHILKFPKTWNKAWKGMAKSNDYSGHTAQEWKDFWETIILPEYCKRREKVPEDFVDSKYLGGTIEDDDEDMSEEEEHEDNDVEEEEEERHDDQEVELGTGLGLPQPEREAEVEGSAVASSPGEITCTKCFVTESRKWRHDKEGKPLCDDCGWFLKSSGILRPSNAWTEVGEHKDKEEEQQQQHKRISGTTKSNPPPPQPAPNAVQTVIAVSTPGRVDVGVQTSPIIPSATPEKRRQKSPSFELESPSLSRPPGPNEARKRSAGRSSQSNSQDTNKSSNQSQKAVAKSMAAQRLPEADQQHKTRQVRLQGSEPPEPAPPNRKKRRLQDDPNTLEIPPTPEHIQTQPGSFDVMNAQRSFTSTSPQPHRFRRKDSPAPPSPLFVPLDSDEEDVPELPSPVYRENRESSPMMINLVSDDDQLRISSLLSQQNQDDNLSEAETSSQYAFETAPDVSQDWETAPEEAIADNGTSRARIETQVSFDIIPEEDTLGDDFELPAPEGGWEVIEDPPSPTADAAPADKRVIPNPINPRLNGSEDDFVADFSFEISSLDAWRAHLSRLHPASTIPVTADLESIAFAAIHATSFDFRLATDVVAQILTLHSSSSHDIVQEGGLVLPDDMPGCWTEEDDNLLFSPNARDWDKAARKHGEERCNQRFDFLETWHRV